MLTTYTTAGGDMWQTAFNAVVSIIGTSAWDGLLKMVEGLAVLGIMYSFSSKKDPVIFLKWAALLTFITTVLLIPKRDIQIIDITNPAGVYQVDNVPAGLAMISSMTTTIGHGFAQLFDSMLARPDSVSYSKTGMLFGSNLIERAQDITTQDPVLSEVLPKYMETCVMGDIMISGKYSMQELMNSRDPIKLITRSPSQIRGIYSPNSSGGGVQFVTCKEAAIQVIIPRLNRDTSVAGSTWRFYVNRWFGNKTNPDMLMTSLLSNSYQYFYNSGKSASDIVKQNVINSAMRQGIKTFAGRSNDSANMVNLATETAANKQRVSWATNMKMGAYWMPLMQSILMLILVLSFPIIIVMAIVNHSVYGIKSIFNYIKAFVYFQTWPLMFAIINFACTYYLKSDGVTDVVLSNTDLIAQRHSDMMMVAGGLCMSIPVLSYYLTKGTVDVVSQVAGSMGSSMAGVASQQASTAADGNWSFNNMQMDNVNANKHDTNSVYKSGQYSQQQANGSMVTQTADGGMVINTQDAMSKLASHLGLSKQLSAAAQQRSQESLATAQSMLEGANHSISNSFGLLHQYASQRGSSDAFVTGSDSSTGSAESQNVSKMLSSAKVISQLTGWSESKSFDELMRRSVDKKAEAHAGFDIPGLKLGGSVSVAGTDNDSHGYQTNGGTNESGNQSKANQAYKDFKEGLDYFTNRKTSVSGSNSKNEAQTLADNITATFNDASQKYQQYTDSETRSHDYAELASRTATLSNDQQENLDQEFVKFALTKSHGGLNALSDVSTEEGREARQELIDQFIRNKISPVINESYNEETSRLGTNMPSVTDETGTNMDYSSNVGQVDNHVPKNGIPMPGEVHNEVQNQENKVSANVQNDGAKVKTSKEELEKQQQEAADKNKNKEGEQTKKLNKEKDSQALVADKPPKEKDGVPDWVKKRGGM